MAKPWLLPALLGAASLLAVHCAGEEVWLCRHGGGTTSGATDGSTFTCEATYFCDTDGNDFVGAVLSVRCNGTPTQTTCECLANGQATGRSFSGDSSTCGSLPGAIEAVNEGCEWKLDEEP